MMESHTSLVNHVIATGNINIDLFIKFVDAGMNFGKTGGGVGENPIVAPVNQWMICSLKP